MSIELDNIKQKIRALLSKTTAAGCSEEEAKTAVQMAMGLMTKYGIEQDAIGGEAIKARIGEKNPRMVASKIDLISAAGILYGCRAIFYDRGKSGFAFLGRADNIDAAEVTALWLIDQVDQLFKTYANQAGMKAKNSDHGKFRANFKTACAYRVRNRAVELINNPQLIAAATGQNALVVKDYFEKLQRENTEALKNTATKALQFRAKTYGIGSFEGLKAGEQVKLRKEVA